MLANARVLAGSGWMGLKDREAFVTRGVKLIPMFTGFLALAALLALLALTWWREGRKLPARRGSAAAHFETGAGQRRAVASSVPSGNRRLPCRCAVVPPTAQHFAAAE